MTMAMMITATIKLSGLSLRSPSGSFPLFDIHSGPSSMDGPTVGAAVGAVVAWLGRDVGSVMEGELDGILDGAEEGSVDGRVDGVPERAFVGSVTEGALDGRVDGVEVGSVDGMTLKKFGSVCARTREITTSYPQIIEEERYVLFEQVLYTLRGETPCQNGRTPFAKVPWRGGPTLGP